MSVNNENIENKLHSPHFKWSFLLPKFWGIWIAIFFSIIFAFLPVTFRDWLGRKLAKLIVKKGGRMIHRTRVNLAYCFPDWSKEQQQALLHETFVKACQYMLGYSELLIRSKRHNHKRGKIVGADNLFPLLESGEPVIILAPHAWALDYSAVMLASRGYKVTNIMRPQKNPVGDWLMHLQRMQYGGRIFSRDAGVKPFIRSIRDGYIGYWVPDEDLGKDLSVIVPFFGTEKATLKGFGKMARLSKAKIVPLFTIYNEASHQYEVHIKPALIDFPSGNEETDARRLNEVVEELVSPFPEHYMWNLPLLKTQRVGGSLYRRHEQEPLP